MDVSPFPHHGPLEPHQVRGRDALVTDLVERLTEHRVTALLGPRRFGKTSVLRRVSATMTEVHTVWVDLFGATTYADLVAMFADGMTAVQGHGGEALRQAARSLSLNLAAVRFELSSPAKQQPDSKSAFRDVIQTLVEAVRRVPVVLVLDEFQDVARVEGAQEVMRTAFQNCYQQMGLVFAGSQPSMMRELFTDRHQPFFAQADLVEIGPLDAAAVAEIVASGFASTGRHAGPLGDLLAESCGGHPHRTMQVADLAWRNIPRDGEATRETHAEALRAAVEQETFAFEALFRRMPQDQQKVLRALASGGSPFGTEGQRLDLSKAGATHARDRLLADGVLTGGGSHPRVTDPLLSRWLTSAFPM